MIYCTILFTLVLASFVSSNDYWASLGYFMDQYGISLPATSRSNLISTRMMPSASSPTCGNRGSEFKIVGGNEATDGEWPWMAAIGYREGSSMNFDCGGALISSIVVVTAAHCVYKRPDLYLVRLGANSLDKGHGVDYLISDRVVHPLYLPSSNENDIALLRMASPAKISRFIRPICLPAADLVPFTNNSQAWIAGWGAEKYGGKYNNNLSQARILILENSVCVKAFKPFGQAAVIDERVLCAGVLDGSKDACQGDSGGPLMWRDLDEPFRIIGIVSYGYRCGEPNFPGIYTFVPMYLTWINQQLRSWS